MSIQSLQNNPGLQTAAVKANSNSENGLAKAQAQEAKRAEKPEPPARLEKAEKPEPAQNQNETRAAAQREMGVGNLVEVEV